MYINERAETYPRGRRGRFAKPLDRESLVRGFESLCLRHYVNPPQCLLGLFLSHPERWLKANGKIDEISDFPKHRSLLNQ